MIDPDEEVEEDEDFDFDPDDSRTWLKKRCVAVATHRYTRRNLEAYPNQTI